MKVTKKQRRKRGAGARERNERPHVYHQVKKNPIFLVNNFHLREALLPRKTEVEENSNQGMVDRVKMRTGDTGETLKNIDSLTTIYFSSYVPV